MVKICIVTANPSLNLAHASRPSSIFFFSSWTKSVSRCLDSITVKRFMDKFQLSKQNEFCYLNFIIPAKVSTTSFSIKP